MFSHRIQRIGFFIGDIKMDVPQWYIWHLPLTKTSDSTLACVIRLCVCVRVESVLLYLKVSEYVQADPVTVRVRNEAQAHVGSGVVEVTNEIHRQGTAFRTQHGVQFSGPDHLIGGSV